MGAFGESHEGLVRVYINRHGEGILEVIVLCILALLSMIGIYYTLESLREKNRIIKGVKNETT
jgi:hypothetical protein